MSTVAVIGPGAIGAVVAAAIESAGVHELSVCARRPRPALTIERDGFEPVRLRAEPLLDHSSARPVEWVLLAVKAHQTDGAADWLRALTDSSTTVVVLQNGVRHQERVAAYVGDGRVVPASIWIGSEVVGSTVRVRGSSRIQVPDDPAGRAFADLMAGTWIAVETAADFALESWRKLTLNAIAGLMVLAGRRAVIFRQPGIHELSRRLSLECAAVARAEGAELSDEAALALADLLTTQPVDGGTSMLFDREKGLPLEWQARNGVIRDLGAAHGIPTPVSDVIVPLLEAASG